MSDLEEAGDQDIDTEPVDTDGDDTADFRDDTDNCRLVANADQLDLDEGGIGDGCAFAGLVVLRLR